METTNPVTRIPSRQSAGCGFILPPKRKTGTDIDAGTSNPGAAHVDPTNQHCKIDGSLRDGSRRRVRGSPR